MQISDQYREMQQKLHEREDYGVASVSFASMVTSLINKTEAKTLLDFGAGKGRLIQHIKPDHDIECTLYEPAMPQWAEMPEGKFDLLTCIDVLEHIEPDCLDEVLDAIGERTGEYAFLTVHTGPAVKTLPDGRNAHLIQEPPMWWLSRIGSRLHLATFQRITNGFVSVWQSRLTQS